MEKKTRFSDIAVGTKFIFGGNDRREYVKVSATKARLVEGGAKWDVPARKEVVTETGASIADILGSWSKL
jgi:hypothetical protein